MKRALNVWVVASMFAAGCPITPNCAPMDDGSSTTTPVTANPFQDFFDQGLTRYAGTPVVTPTSATHSALFPNIDVHKFANPGRGPICMRGGDFFVETREGPSDDLMIFLEGGGVCLDEVCAVTATPLLSLRAMAAGDLVGIGGLLDKSDANNPVADYDLVHTPYCDGSIFLGDVDRELSDGNDLNGTHDMAYQRGLLNLTATMEVAHRTFPSPRRIVLAGSSGGSYGVLLGVAMARHYYPSTPIVVVADSGAPILTSEDPLFIRRILTELGSINLLPPSCPDCISNGHATGAIEWALDHDPNLAFAYLGHARDHVIGEFFMGSTADEFQASVVRETGRIVDRFPTRAFRFVVPGNRHTLALDVATAPAGLQHTVLGVFGPLALTGPDASRAELATWTLGGMKEEGHDESGHVWTGYAWLDTVLNRRSQAVNVVQLTP